MKRLLEIVLITLGGYLVFSASHERDFIHSPIYTYIIHTLLAIGLYGSVYGIDNSLIKGNRQIIFNAITIGVFLKTIIIGGLVWLSTQNIYAFILGVVVAQIDPLSVAAIGKNKQLSERGNTILSAWSSFDDPMTIILSIYLGNLLTDNTKNLNFDLTKGYFINLILNFSFAFIIFLAHKVTKKIKYFDYILIIISFALAVYLNYMLAIAIIGLFLRPYFNSYIDKTINVAFIASLLILGYLLSNGINLKTGILLGFSAVIAQIIVGFILTYKLERNDRIYLAIAQQNGITAIILALMFEPMFSGTVGIVAPAILTINILYAINNNFMPQLLKNTEGGIKLDEQDFDEKIKK
jgi:NhaP-type Na+/H+ or K+/H+ antiporter